MIDTSGKNMRTLNTDIYRIATVNPKVNDIIIHSYTAPSMSIQNFVFENTPEKTYSRQVKSVECVPDIIQHDVKALEEVITKDPQAYLLEGRQDKNGTLIIESEDPAPMANSVLLEYQGDFKTVVKGARKTYNQVNKEAIMLIRSSKPDEHYNAVVQYFSKQ